MANHFLMVYKEPPQILNFKTDLVGRGWDLKNLIGIKEKESLLLDPETNAGIFEVYDINFGTGNFFLSIQARWAGYLLNPEGNLSKQWAFIKDLEPIAGAYTDDSDPRGFDHWCW